MASTPGKKKTEPTQRVRAPRKKAVPAPAPAEPPPATGEAESTPTPKPVTITFADRTMLVKMPNAEQIALLIDMQKWSKQLKDVKAQIAALNGNLDDDSDLAKLGQQLIRRLQRMSTIIGAVIPEDDWEDIQDMMADGKVEWADVADIPARVIQAHNDAGQLIEDNRATKRAGARGQRV